MVQEILLFFSWGQPFHKLTHYFLTNTTDTSILGVVTRVETQSSKTVTVNQGTLCP